MDDKDSAAMSLFEGMVLFDHSELSPSLPLPMSSFDSDTAAAAALMNSGPIHRENEGKGVRVAHTSLPPTPNSSMPDSALSAPTTPSVNPASESVDEDLFSNLTLLTPTPRTSLTTSPREPSPRPEKLVIGSAVDFREMKVAGHTTLPLELPGNLDHASLPARQMSRKKKRGVRVGYARESTPAVTPPSVSPALPARLEVSEADGYTEAAVQNHQIDRQSFEGGSTLRSYHAVEELESRQSSPQPLKDPIATGMKGIEEQIQRMSSEAELSADSHSEIFQDCQVDDGSSFKGTDISTKEHDLPVEFSPIPASPRKRDAFLLAEERFELIRAQVTEKLDKIRGQALSVWAEKKNLAKLLRNAAEDVNSVSLRLKNLERELEEACEAEDFETAERVSQDLAAAEEEKNRLQGKMKKIECDCETVDSKMEDILRMQIAAEEEGTLLFRQFSQDSSADADAILKNADEISSQEMEVWQLMSEALEMNRLQTDVELHLTNGVSFGFESSLQQVTQTDLEEKEKLCSKQKILSKELEELLELVRLKETQISENKMLIEEVEKKISNAMLEYKDSQKAIDSNFERLQSTLSKIELEAEALSLRKQTVDKNHDAAKCKGLKLKEISHASADEARKINDSVKLRNLLTLPILKSREDKLKLAKTEEEILKDVEILKQHVSTARLAIQEFSLHRSRIQEEIASFKQRASFIDIRCPELENEKKAAATARNFKEAGRIAAEAKALSLEKESIQAKIEKSALDLEKIEGDINNNIRKIRENEDLILSKEKEAARTAFQKLHSTVATAKAERFAALTLGDTEEDGISLKEVEAAENRARELQGAYGFDEMDLDQVSEQLFSLSLITCLSGKELALFASSLNIPVTDDT